ncbi:MAG: leucine-rich repeat domain-containing protein [Dehalococcoidales bacterium]|nr:leucine-rich repeat domain-containing protein [Dehalococcoidales bacterium]
MKHTKYILIVTLLLAVLTFPACSLIIGEQTGISTGIPQGARSVEEYFQELDVPASETGLKELKAAVGSILSPIPLPTSLPDNYQVRRVIPRESGIIAKGIKVPEINLVLSDGEIPGELDPNDFHLVSSGSADLWPEIFDTIGHRSIVVTLSYWRGYPVPGSYYYDAFLPSPEDNYLPEYLGLETGDTERIGSADVYLMTQGATAWAEWRLPDWDAPQFIVRVMPGKEVSPEDFREVIASIDLPEEEFLLPYPAEDYSTDRLFPDPNLEAYFLDNFPGLTAPVTAKDVKEVDAISASGRNIVSLAGLEHCPNLKYLNLENNHIADLSPLGRLDNLIEVNLTGNLITDVTPLAKHKNLKKLEMGYNRIIDVEPLASLTELEYLDLGWNQVDSSSAALSRLTRLTHLDLGVNNIPDIIAIGGGLKNLRYLYLNHNLIQGTQPLSGLAMLESLYLSDNQIEDISPLSGLTNLRNLGLYHNRISDITVLAGLEQLEYLDLRVNSIKDLAPLNGVSLPELIRIDLNYNYISDASPLTQASLPKLEIITLQGNRLTEEEMMEIRQELTTHSK